MVMSPGYDITPDPNPKAHKEHRKKSEERRRLDAKKERRVKAKESHSKRQEDSCGCKVATEHSLNPNLNPNPLSIASTLAL